jgi:oligopeptide transport system substrate-binding protein
MKKLVSVLLAAAMVLSLMAGCSTYTDSSSNGGDSSNSTVAAGDENGSDASEVSTADQSFTLLASGPVTLNPLQSQSSNDTDVFYLIYTTLVRMYQDEVEFDGAESVDVNDDCTEFTFHIRDNIYYTDGTQVTANDYAFYVEATLDPTYGSPNANTWYILENGEAFSNGECTWEEVGCTVEDDYTLTFTLNRPFADFLKYLACDFVVPLQKDFVDAEGDNMGSGIDHIMSCGPYVLTDWQLESSLTFEKNPDYWNAENSFFVQHVEVLEVDNANTKVGMYEDGSADAMMVVPSEYLDTMEDEVVVQSTGGINMLWLNEAGENGEIMGNSNFGLALSYALNREEIMNAINPSTRAAVRLVDETFTTENGTSYQEAYPVDYVSAEGDTAKAQEYLAKALEELGYSDVSELPTLTYVTYENSEQKLIAEAIIDTWKTVLGVNVQLEQYQIGTAIGMFYSGGFDMFNIGIECGVYSYYLMESFIPGGDYANGCWNNEEFNALIEDAKNATSEEDVLNYVHQAEQVMLSDAGVLPIFYQGSGHVSHDYVENYVVSTLGAGWQLNYLHVNK